MKFSQIRTLTFFVVILIFSAYVYYTSYILLDVATVHQIQRELIVSKDPDFYLFEKNEKIALNESPTAMSSSNNQPEIEDENEPGEEERGFRIRKPKYVLDQNMQHKNKWKMEINQTMQYEGSCLEALLTHGVVISAHATNDLKFSTDHLSFDMVIDKKQEQIKAKKCISIIIPYRRRRNQLEKFLREYHNVFSSLSCYKIFVIEQDDHFEFNRGMLLNIGFIESLKLRRMFNDCDLEFSHVIFHDLDTLPDSSSGSRASEMGYWPFDIENEKKTLFDLLQKHKQKDVVQLSPYFMHPKYSSPSFHGGNWLFSFQSFIDINGFSNIFWGWGEEDDNLGYRVYRSKYHPFSYPWIRLLSDISKYIFTDHQNKLTHHDVEPIAEEKSFIPTDTDHMPPSRFHAVRVRGMLTDLQSGLKTIASQYKIIKPIQELAENVSLIKVGFYCDAEITPSCVFHHRAEIQPRSCAHGDCDLQHRVADATSLAQIQKSSFDGRDLVVCPNKMMSKIFIYFLPGVDVKQYKLVRKQIAKRSFLNIHHCSTLDVSYYFSSTKNFKLSLLWIENYMNGLKESDLPTYVFLTTDFVWMDLPTLLDDVEKKNVDKPHILSAKFADLVILPIKYFKPIISALKEQDIEAHTSMNKSLIDVLKQHAIDQYHNVHIPIRLSAKMMDTTISGSEFILDKACHERFYILDFAQSYPKTYLNIQLNPLQIDLFSALSARSRLVKILRETSKDKDKFPNLNKNLTQIFCSPIGTDVSWTNHVSSEILFELTLNRLNNKQN